ncbi:S41 family peptidase, partial [Dysgonomonas gadei]|uniref:S41 family peptidase n=1 Tax=Dysgonomonas gadei TaxID=156974 RepID=UPI003AF03F7A
FYNILYKYKDVNGDRFSWIEEDVSKKTKSLYADTSLGFDYIPYSYFPTKTDQNSSIGFFIISVNKGSDAEAKGLKRGQIIYAIDDTPVTYDNYSEIFEGKASFKLSVYNKDGIKQTLETIQASATKTSPVFISKVIKSSGTSIGYLMYNAFERGPDEDGSNYDYDIELIESMRTLNNQGITEFVLDLRYNLGGYLTSAMDLASALYKDRTTSKIFAKETYNKYFSDSLVAKYGSNGLNEYFLDKVYNTNIEIPRLNISRVYIIATENSASASELLIHGLRPYMPVYHIGKTTVGKDKGSITIKAESDRIKWQLQPLVSRITDANGEGNYINGLTPDFEISEWEEGYQMVDAYYEENGINIKTQLPLLSDWKGGFSELGDSSEPLLAEAIAQITGVARVKTTKSITHTDWVAKKVPFIKQDKKRAKILLDK